jgi:hypothetical protein
MSRGDQNHCPCARPGLELLEGENVNPQVINGESMREGGETVALLRRRCHHQQMKMRAMVAENVMGDNGLSCAGVVLTCTEMQEELSGSGQR